MAIEALEGKDTNASSRKGVFIPDITVEMFRNASLEGVEGLMESGEMEDISLPSTQPEIIQCKDCKHSIDFYGDGECYCRRPNRELDWIGDWNFYCGCAERQEE